MELFDILDEQGHSTGRTAPKGSALCAGEYYMGVHIYIVNASGDFLLQQRALDKEFLPGGWEIHLGHVIAGESSIACAKREVLEELGLSLDETQLRYAGRILWEDERHMTDIYFARVEFQNEVLALQASEVIGTKSVNTEEMRLFVQNMTYRPLEYRQLVLEYMETAL